LRGILTRFYLCEIREEEFFNSHNHLPDAVEATEEFHESWYFWGDVKQRTYFDNWELFQGVVYPTTQVVERSGLAFHADPECEVRRHSLAESESRPDNR
jgi:hypothetical protein